MSPGIIHKRSCALQLSLTFWKGRYNTSSVKLLPDQTAKVLPGQVHALDIRYTEQLFTTDPYREERTQDREETPYCAYHTMYEKEP